MLEDLRLVRNNQPPEYARRVVDLDSLAKIEETGKTVDLVPNPSTPSPDFWSSRPIAVMYWIAGASIFVNIILVILLLLLHK